MRYLGDCENEHQIEEQLGVGERLWLMRRIGAKRAPRVVSRHARIAPFIAPHLLDVRHHLT